MDIPDECKPWAEAMESESGTEKHRRILGNVRGDACVSDKTASEFFARLAVQLAAQGPPANADAALTQASDVVKADPDTFLCQGKAVPQNLFRQLFRIEKVERLVDLLPEEGVGGRLGLDPKKLDWAKISTEDLAVLTDEYDGPVRLGNKLGVVWVTDYEAVQDLAANPDTLSDVLGRPAANGSSRYVICVYNRVETGRSLHVPRCLDGIDHEHFEVTTDCGAPFGRTSPISHPKEGGKPEAVHRSCTVKPVRWEQRLGV